MPAACAQDRQLLMLLSVRALSSWHESPGQRLLGDQPRNVGLCTVLIATEPCCRSQHSHLLQNKLKCGSKGAQIQSLGIAIYTCISPGCKSPRRFSISCMTIIFYDVRASRQDPTTELSPREDMKGKRQLQLRRKPK